MAIETFEYVSHVPDETGVAEWDGTNHEELADWLSVNDDRASPWSVQSVTATTLVLRLGFGSTPDETVTMSVGDWIEPNPVVVRDASARASLSKVDSSGKYVKLTDLLPQGSPCPLCQRPLP